MEEWEGEKHFCLKYLLYALPVYRSPVKKRSLIKEERLLTPRQRVDLRKRQRADQEAERIKQAAAQNYNEGRKRFKEHRKKQVVPLFY